MTDIKYTNLLEELRYIAESAILQLRSVLDEVDFTALQQSIEQLSLENCYWTVLEEILTQLVSFINKFQTASTEVANQLDRSRRLSDRQQEEYLTVDNEISLLEKEIRTLKAKVVELKGVKKKLRQQYVALSIKLDTIKDQLSAQTERNRSLERKNKSIVVIKPEPAEQINYQTIIMSTEQKRELRHEVEQLHRDYTQLNKSKRNLKVVSASKNRLAAKAEKLKKFTQTESEMSEPEIIQHNKILDRLGKENHYLEKYYVRFAGEPSGGCENVSLQSDE